MRTKWVVVTYVNILVVVMQSFRCTEKSIFKLSKVFLLFLTCTRMWYIHILFDVLPVTFLLRQCFNEQSRECEKAVCKDQLLFMSRSLKGRRAHRKLQN